MQPWSEHRYGTQGAHARIYISLGRRRLIRPGRPGRGSHRSCGFQQTAGWPDWPSWKSTGRPPGGQRLLAGCRGRAGSELKTLLIRRNPAEGVAIMRVAMTPFPHPATTQPGCCIPASRTRSVPPAFPNFQRPGALSERNWHRPCNRRRCLAESRSWKK